MKNIYIGLFALIVTAGLATTNQAHALSCLPTDMYLKDVIGDEEILIFEGTSLERTDESSYTSEVVKVTDAKQGYLESEIFVYHEKDETWGYLCNAGPKVKGSTGVYVGTRTSTGKYLIYQRLELTDPLVATVEADLQKAGITGEASELTAIDRKNQIITTIGDLLKEIKILIAEYTYWSKK